MDMKKYLVTYELVREVNAEDEAGAAEAALLQALDGNGYYVHDYLDFKSAKVIGDYDPELDD